MSSDSTGSIWALEYFTTPSSPCSTGPSPLHSNDRVHLDRRDHRDLLESEDVVVLRRHVVDGRGSDRTPGGAGVAEDLALELGDAWVRDHSRTRLAIKLRPATKLPRWGVQMNTTRETWGTGSTNIARRSKSWMSGESVSSSSGLRLAASQSRFPLLTTCILTSRPP